MEGWYICSREGVVISKLVLQDKDKSNPYYRFSLTVYLNQKPVEWVGWRYWPKSGDLKPPMFKTGRNWQWYAVFPKDEKESLWEEIKEAVQQAVKNKENSVHKPADENKEALFDLYLGLDQLTADGHRPEPIFEFRRQFPQYAREFFIRSLDDELKVLFEGLPEGRLWPDEYLKKKAEDVTREVWTVDDLVEHKKLGIFSDGDFKRIYEFLGGKR